MTDSTTAREPITETDLVDLIVRAVRERTIDVAFQPVVRLPERTVEGVEALARLTHDGTPIPPASFIPAAEAAGIVHEVDLLVLDRACAELHRHLDGGGRRLMIGVNLSPLTLDREGIADDLLAVVRRHGLPTGLVVFEITEGTRLENGALSALAHLRSEGCLISLDDFGSGWSGLSRLSYLAFDSVKIDRAIVLALDHGTTAPAVLRSIVSLGRELDVRVLAEGIENEQQEATVLAAGVRLMQGYHYSVPTSFDVAVRALDRGFAAPALHPDEEARLAALRRYDVLDTPPEEAFDALTRLAAQICGTEMALVSLVDDARQWFKSTYGTDLVETSREVSFCAHAILDDDVMIVDDATRDERFAGNPLVAADDGIRFYAGAPLKSSDGFPVGTLCVISNRPSELDERQRNLLRTLADQVVAHLELRAANTQLQREVELRIETETRLRHEATHDQLTGLANRRLYFETLRERVARHDTGIVYVDLDGFKEVNDSFGHHVGDHLLRWSADHLCKAVGRRGLVARLGGDEFAVVVTDTAADPARVATDVAAALNQPVEFDGVVLVSRASVGTSVCRRGQNVDAAMRDADSAMYRDKQRR
jgi:diguanylate cyclase (GGDEF)-like protein